MKTIGVIVIALAMLIALTGVVMADQVVPAVPEVQGISSSVSIVCEGTVQNSAALGWQLANQDVISGDQGLAPRGDGYSTSWNSMLDPTQVQYSTTYDASTVAQHGQTTFIKSMAVGTGNKLLTQSNVKANTESTFFATDDGGNILGTESIMIDGAAMPTSASDRILCPFGNAGENVIPAYCNIATANSKYDLVIGSVVSTANDRFVGTDATIPVELGLTLNVKPYQVVGQGMAQAQGSATSTFKVSVKEGRHGYIGNVTDLVAQGRLYTTGNGAQPYMDYVNPGLSWWREEAQSVWHPGVQPLHWNDVGLLIASGNMTGVGIGPKNEDLTYTETSTAVGAFSYNAAYNFGSGPSPMP